MTCVYCTLEPGANAVGLWPTRSTCCRCLIEDQVCYMNRRCPGPGAGSVRSEAQVLFCLIWTSGDPATFSHSDARFVSLLSKAVTFSRSFRVYGLDCHVEVKYRSNQNGQATPPCSLAKIRRGSVHSSRGCRWIRFGPNAAGLWCSDQARVQFISRLHQTVNLNSTWTFRSHSHPQTPDSSWFTPYILTRWNQMLQEATPIPMKWNRYPCLAWISSLMCGPRKMTGRA